MAVTLYYYDLRGVAEPIRIILSYGGVKFEDVRVPFIHPPTLPPEVKSNSTWGQIPCVVVDGKRLSQSLAITRYFAKKYNLIPSDDYEAALCDEYVDACRDYLNLWIALANVSDEAELKKKIAEVRETSNQRFLTVFNLIIEANDGKHLIGKNLTWSDIYLAHVINQVELCNSLDILGEFPGIKSLSEAVFSEPGIKEWMEKRPETKY